ncbi:hypothetical protein [Neobacillus niacini]|uniref:hypothetical protein n=1 Tax=Neobacillus niacini TaxID=86668 RepID=UPI002858EC9F|nr:hypothetical protein [Neobacillus niacini]MDR6999935.1 ABC-type Na+ efflux pump permease subunit [Neobacillus niacini]
MAKQIIQQTDHKYFFLSLIIIYPLLFLLQGVVTAMLNSSILLTLAVSVFGFLVTVLLWANSSAFGYVIVYLLIGFLGYGLVRFFQRGK